MMEGNKQYKPQAIIEVTQSGPLKITGNILIKDMKRGTEDSSGEILLCLCGKSENQPFCDDSHKRK